MKRIRHVMVGCGALVPALLAAQRVAEAPRAEIVAQAREIVEQFVETSGVPGLAVAVGVGSNIVWSEGFGFANVEQRAPAWPTTRFRIGSVSKSLTAAAVGLLVERRRLDLDAPVQRYLPGFPDKRGPVTTRLLGGHLAGIRHYRGSEFQSTTRYPTVQAGLAIFADDTLLFAPGQRFSYSSYGWNLISAVVEAAAGVPFLDFMRDEVFTPLGMYATVADFTDSLIPQRTSYYLEQDGRVLNAPFVDNSYKWAGGGFLSTAEDIVTFALAHLGTSFLRRETIELLWTSQRTADGQETGYGIGWSTRRDEHGRRVVSHGGGSMGGTTMMLLYPDLGVAVALLSNATGLSYGDVPIQLAEAFLPH